MITSQNFHTHLSEVAELRVLEAEHFLELERMEHSVVSAPGFANELETESNITSVHNKHTSCYLPYFAELRGQGRSGVALFHRVASIDHVAAPSRVADLQLLQDEAPDVSVAEQALQARVHEAGVAQVLQSARARLRVDGIC